MYQVQNSFFHLSQSIRVFELVVDAKDAKPNSTRGQPFAYPSINSDFTYSTCHWKCQKEKTKEEKIVITDLYLRDIKDVRGISEGSYYSTENLLEQVRHFLFYICRLFSQTSKIDENHLSRNHSSVSLCKVALTYNFAPRFANEI